MKTSIHMDRNVYVCTSKDIGIESKRLNKKSHYPCFSSIPFTSLKEPPKHLLNFLSFFLGEKHIFREPGIMYYIQYVLP